MLQLLPLGPGASQWLPVVACRDCCVRIMGLDGKPLFEVATGSPPTAVRCALRLCLLFSDARGSQVQHQSVQCITCYAPFLAVYSNSA